MCYETASQEACASGYQIILGNSILYNCFGVHLYVLIYRWCISPRTTVDDNCDRAMASYAAMPTTDPQLVGLLQDFSFEPEFGDVVGHWTRIGRAKGRTSQSGHPLQPQLGCEPCRLEIRSKIHPGVPWRTQWWAYGADPLLSCEKVK